jgi:hypothetical protein
MYHYRQYLSGKEPGRDMHMIRHDAPRKEPIAFLIKVTQGIGQFFCDGGILQVASATVEEALNHWSREARDFRFPVGQPAAIADFDLAEAGAARRRYGRL